MTTVVAQWCPAPHIQTIRTEHLVVVLDRRTGGVTVLTGVPRENWESLHLRPGSGEAFPDSGSMTRFHARGWLIPVTVGGGPRPPMINVADPAGSWGTQEARAQVGAAPRPLWRWRLAAIIVLLLTLAVRDLGSARTRFARMTRLAHIGGHFPWADESSIQQAVRSVRWAARGAPARIACLEESVAASLLLTLARRRARWTHGVAVDPLRFHAWLAGSDGRPVEEPADTAHYVPINFDPGGARE